MSDGTTFPRQKLGCISQLIFFTLNWKRHRLYRWPMLPPTSRWSPISNQFCCCYCCCIWYSCMEKNLWLSRMPFWTHLIVEVIQGESVQLLGGSLRLFQADELVQVSRLRVVRPREAVRELPGYGQPAQPVRTRAHAEQGKLCGEIV